jgi:hypothetical protein
MDIAQLREALKGAGVARAAAEANVVDLQRRASGLALDGRPRGGRGAPQSHVGCARRRGVAGHNDA